MRIKISNKCPETDGYRAARVKSMFNCESGALFEREFELDIDPAGDWRIGLVVGPSGSGKSSLGRRFFGRASYFAPGAARWPRDEPVIEAIAPNGDFDAVTGALSAVGLGDVPAWLRPYRVLSTGERFRADLARIVAEAPPSIVIDEFTSVVDRQIAKIGAFAFGKAWRRTGGKAVALSCHYDVVDWLGADWILDTATGKFSGNCLRRRPPITFDMWRTNWRYWPTFAPHHYLSIPNMIAAKCYVAAVDGEPVAHVAVSTVVYGRNGFEARACRLVVMPEWQGCGLGTRFLDAVCRLQLTGGEGAIMPGVHLSTCFHTSHPGLCRALRRRRGWTQVSARLYGESKARSAASIMASRERSGSALDCAVGYGGHFRAVQGFRFIGTEEDRCA